MHCFCGDARQAIKRWSRHNGSYVDDAIDSCDAASPSTPPSRQPRFGPFAGCDGARRGTYRIVYRIEEDNRVVQVVDIDHRADIDHRPQE